MFKQFIFTLGLVTALLFTPLTSANAATCAYSQERLFDDAEQQKMKMWGVSKRAFTAIVDKINEVRSNRGDEAWVVDNIFFGIFEHNGQLMAAVFFLKDGCTIPDSTLVMPAGYWAQAMMSLGLEDKDFIPVQGS